MADAPLVFQLHTLFGMVLFALWPFSRLVHAFTAPLGYLNRPYVVYRSRAPRSGTVQPPEPRPVPAPRARARARALRR